MKFMRIFSLRACIFGACMLCVTLVQSAWGHPPFAFFDAYLFSIMLMLLSMAVGSEWGLCTLLFIAIFSYILRDIPISAAIISLTALVWYGVTTFWVARDSRVLMSLATGWLFFGLLLERMKTFSWSDWRLFCLMLMCNMCSVYFFAHVLNKRTPWKYVA